MRHRLPFAALLVSMFCAAPLAAGTSDQAEAELANGNRLAAVLRTGRNVLSSNQELINDPALGDKGLTGSVFVAQVIAAYTAQNGEPPVTDDLSEVQRRLTEAQLSSMAEVIDESQTIFNAEGVGFKGFIPAIFARLVNERFAEKMQAQARVKVTAPGNLVRNRKARPDAWEDGVIEGRFRSAGWEKGAPFYEEVQLDGQSAFRMLIPEYYSTSCLSCHGTPAGEMDVTGFPKEGGAEGDLAGAISITFFR
ncbi:MAG: DUF3365 domain-containing protein [Pseudomonadota bacterium]|nr:DUF3365 domain-containing protein [Pseudomonadota bacterium]